MRFIGFDVKGWKVKKGIPRLFLGLATLAFIILCRENLASGMQGNVDTDKTTCHTAQEMQMLKEYIILWFCPVGWDIKGLFLIRGTTGSPNRTREKF